MQQVKMYHCFGLHAMGFVSHNGEGRLAGQCETETGPVTVSHLRIQTRSCPPGGTPGPAWTGLPDRIAGQDCRTGLPDRHRSTKDVQNRKPARRIVRIV
ncbi:MAG: hypothetical protein OXI37_03160 [Gammaproteobacteria bacterium]|nr:hypothetical protein [Gammaproteobacteria bacterium]